MSRPHTDTDDERVTVADVRRSLARSLSARPPPRSIAPAGYWPVLVSSPDTGPDLVQMPAYDAALALTGGLVTPCRPALVRAWKRAPRRPDVATLGRLRTAAIVHGRGARHHA